MALRRSLLRIDTASLLQTFGSLKIRNFGNTPSCLQLLRKSNDYSCKDTFSFVSQIKNANLSKKFLVSYDVTWNYNTNRNNM